MKDKILKILDKVGERSLFPSEGYDAILELFKEEKMELERIEGMRKKLPEFGYSYGDDEIRIGYNQALDDVLSALKSEEKEEVGE